MANEPRDDDWVSQSDLTDALNMEHQVYGKELTGSQSKHIAQRLFEENAAQAAMSIIHVATHSTNDGLKLKSAQYIIDRALGKIGDKQDGAQDPLEALLTSMQEGSKE
jgi:hypothetical protein